MSHSNRYDLRDEEFDERLAPQRKIKRPRGRQPTFMERQTQLKVSTDPAANATWDRDLIPDNVEHYRPEYG